MILNLTQHPATPEQKAAGVVDLELSARAILQELLTFDNLPDWSYIEKRATAIVAFARTQEPEISEMMIGGAPFLMAPLAKQLTKAGITPCFSFSQRIVEEQPQPDGSVRKISTFKHQGFIWQFGV